MNLTEKTKKLSWGDISLVKLFSILMGIAIGSYFTAYFEGYELWIFILAILIALKPFYAFWVK